MSLLCGRKQKGSKKGKSLDKRPAYGANEEVPGSEEKARLIRQGERLKEVEDTVRRLQEELKDEKNKSRGSKQEAAELRQQLEKLKKIQDTNKVKETNLGVPISSAIEEEKARLSEDLQSVKKEIENERQQGEGKVKQLTVEIDKLSDDLKKANKALETERNTGEAKVNKLTEELKQAKNETQTEKKERTKAEEEREKYKREKDAAENKLAHTSKELEIAKSESHIPRSPTRAPSDEWKAKIETAETELNKERQLRLEKEKENSRLINDRDSLEKEKQTLQNEIQNLKTAKDKEIEDLKTAKTEELEKNLEMNHKNDMRRLEEMVEDLNKKRSTLKAEEEKLLTRLSSQTAAHVLDNNPNVSELSDPNRPQRLGEQLSQVYDDQWTDATEALEKLDKNEEEISKTLLDILVAVYCHCKEAAESQLSKIEEYLFLPPLENTSVESPDTNGTEHFKSSTSRQSTSKIPRFTSHKGRPALSNISTEKKTVDNDNPGSTEKDKSKRSLSQRVKGEKMPDIPVAVRKGIKEYIKKVTKHVWPVIEKEVISKLKKNEEFGDKVIDTCHAYITKCVELCWLMRVQDPPVTLNWNVPDDRLFNTDVYRMYTKSGNHVEYVVWPAMYLYENGPILMKGVAQGIKQ